MNNKILLLAISLISLASFSVSAQSIWTSANEVRHSISSSEMVEFIDQYELVSANYEELVDKLSKAPMEFTKKRGKKISFPMPDGSMKEFAVFESPIMAEKLQEKYPSIRNYKVIATDDSGDSGRIGITTNGFHASIRTREGRIYIDPYADNQTEYYVSYYTTAYGKAVDNLPACGAKSTDEDVYLSEFDLQNIEGVDHGNVRSRVPEGEVQLRTYRCAIACTGEWGQAKGGTVESALSAVNTSLTKINEIFEYEVAIRMILVEDNDKLMHLNANTDPYINSNVGAELIGQNTDAVSNIIGFGNFDIGHVYTNACSDVGGIASLGSVCGSSKGNGVTCHYSSNIDLISVRVACHEIGHQFAASHTFNNCDEENESTGSAYEPGSGWTIMSYAGGCGSAKNVANAPFEYFHGINIEQMTKFSRDGFGDNCANYIETNNTHPIVHLDYVDGFYIPLDTPFRLDGSAEDAEGDPLTYSWEQFDLGPLSLPGAPIGDAPQFVSEVPDESGERILPALSKILTNQYDFNEVLPFFNKDMTWRLTVRDNNDEAGGADWKEVQFYATETAGPFRVLYPNSPESFIAGNEYEITWDVANSDNDLVNCQGVDILLSTDGGVTYPIFLASYTANDGSEIITIPNTPANFVRIMVRASQNIFFDISNSNSQIGPATEAGFSAVAYPGYQALCLPASAEVIVDTESFLNYDTPINFEILSGVPDGANITFAQNPVTPGEDIILDIDAENVIVSGEFNIAIRGISGEDTILLSTIIDITSSDYSDLSTLFPNAGSSGIEALPTFTWVSDTDADSYIFELSDNPSFQNGNINITETGIIDNNFTIEEPLLKNTIYFWRVSGVNQCGVGKTTNYSTFASEALSCRQYAETAVPVNLPSSGTPTVNLESVIVTNGTITDVSVRSLKGTHQNFKDLSAKLISPAGTEVALFSNRCAGATVFNASFDDISPLEIQCPMLNGTVFIPEGDLTAFNGEDLFGKWTLEISDNKAGSGGKVDGYILDICSNASLSAPTLDRNVSMKIGPGQWQLINDGRLRVIDEDSDNDELIYTLVENVEKGTLNLGGTAMIVGDKFTQEDLNSNKISYQHGDANASTEVDQFVFVVDDGEGGWIDVTTFNIEVDVVNSVSDNIFDYSLTLYPNPTSTNVILELDREPAGEYEVTISNILGQQVFMQTVVGKKVNLNLAGCIAGTYFVAVKIEGAQSIYKLVVE